MRALGKAVGDVGAADQRCLLTIPLIESNTLLTLASQATSTYLGIHSKSIRTGLWESFTTMKQRGMPEVFECVHDVVASSPKAYAGLRTSAVMTH